MTGRDIRVGPHLTRDFSSAQFMGRVGVGVQEMDHQRLAPRINQRLNLGAQRILIQRRQNITARIHPFWYFKAQVAGDDRRKLPLHPVRLRSGPPPQFQHITKTQCGDQAGA